MSHFLPSADRKTHFKIVAVALVAVSVLALGFNAQVAHEGRATAHINSDRAPVKAGAPASYTSAADTSMQ